MSQFNAEIDHSNSLDDDEAIERVLNESVDQPADSTVNGVLVSTGADPLLASVKSSLPESMHGLIDEAAKHSDKLSTTLGTENANLVVASSHLALSILGKYLEVKGRS